MQSGLCVTDNCHVYSCSSISIVTTINITINTQSALYTNKHKLNCDKIKNPEVCTIAHHFTHKINYGDSVNIICTRYNPHTKHR